MCKLIPVLTVEVLLIPFASPGFLNSASVCHLFSYPDMKEQL